MSERDWHTRAICPHCADHFRVAFGNAWFLRSRFDCCPTCGQALAPHSWDAGGWVVRAMRWVSEARLLRPSTWGTGRWEDGEAA